MAAPVTRIASATLSGVNPPERANDAPAPIRVRQSKAAPLPPGRLLSAGARASNRMMSAALP